MSTAEYISSNHNKTRLSPSKVSTATREICQFLGFFLPFFINISTKDASAEDSCVCTQRFADSEFRLF